MYVGVLGGIWDSQGFFIALLALLPSAGLVNITNTIISKHVGYQNTLYGVSVTSIEEALAIVKKPERIEEPSNYEQDLRAKIHELQGLVESNVILSESLSKEPVFSCFYSVMVLIFRIEN